MQRIFFGAVVCLAPALVVCGGCSGEKLPPNYATTVTITYEGKPVEGAIVTMRPDNHDAPTATAITGANGTAKMFSYMGKGKGVVPGNYLVAVEKQNVEKVEIIGTDHPDYGKPVDEMAARRERTDLIPKKYVTASSSGLTCTVTEDASKNAFTFNLED